MGELGSCSQALLQGDPHGPQHFRQQGHVPVDALDGAPFQVAVANQVALLHARLQAVLEVRELLLDVAAGPGQGQLAAVDAPLDRLGAGVRVRAALGGTDVHLHLQLAQVLAVQVVQGVDHRVVDPLALLLHTGVLVVHFPGLG